MKFYRNVLLLGFASLLISCGTSSSASSTNPESSDSSSGSDSSYSSETSDTQESSSGESSSPSSEESSEGEPPEKTDIAYTFQDYTYNSVYSISACPSVGNVNVLVLPIWFSSSTDGSTRYINESSKDNVIEDINNVFFGDESSTGWHSLSSFFYEESGGLLNISGAVADWYNCTSTVSQIGSTSSGQALTNRLVVDATNSYFESNPSANRKDFDSDGDGYLDAVCLIYGAPNYYSLGDYYGNYYGNLWAYTYWIQNSYDQTPNVDNPTANAFLWASYDFIYSSSTAYSRTGHSYYRGDTRNMTATNPVDGHTIIHEFGHVLGLNDYYDYTSQYTPAGGFTMQDNNVGGHDPYSVMALGWADPYIPTESCTITIGDFQSTHDLILLTPEWNEYDSPFDEYLLVELYTPTSLNERDTTLAYRQSYPQGANATGLRVWHVDARLTTCTEISSNYETTFSETLTSNPIIDETSSEDFGKYIAMKNTYYTRGAEGYVSVLGEDYYDYNELQLINTSSRSSITDKRTYSFEKSDLFTESTISFNAANQGKQFVNTGCFNNGNPLGWSFSVSISGSGEGATATVKLTRSSN